MLNSSALATDATNDTCSMTLRYYFRSRKYLQAEPVDNLTVMPSPEDGQPTSIGTLDLPPIASTLPVFPQDH